MNGGGLAARSGLRPVTAFLVIGCVLLMVAVSATVIAARQVHASWPERTSASPAPDFDILDRRGEPLAFSVRKLSLVAYPRALWRAHTPERMARRLAPLLGDLVPEGEFLARTIPLADGGWIQIPLDELCLTAEQAARVQAWTSRGVWSTSARKREQQVASDDVPLQGIDVLAVPATAGRSAAYALAWNPSHVLAEATRREQARGKEVSALAWTNALLDGLGRAIRGGDVEGADELERAALRDRQAEMLWRALLPAAGYARLVDAVPLERAHELTLLLEEEAVKPYQLELVPGVERVHPSRLSDGEPLHLLGRWGFVGTARAELLAAERLGGPRPEEPRARAEFDALTRELLAERRAVSGLELVCAERLACDPWAELAGVGAVYRFAELSATRRPRRLRRYYLDAAPASDPPRVVSTLDLGLARYVRTILREIEGVHDPAVTMAIVVDVRSGDVLAVDGLSAVEVAGFLPTWHLFTPGSTFKTVVMATALDAGVVRADEAFDAHHGEYRIPGSTRTIREAEGPRRGIVSAAEGFAQSLNAVFAQIGMRVPDEHFRDVLVRLGYATAPAVGLGTERAGYVPPTPWSPAYTHASIGFGHELQVSLWQHAAALATVLRGGEWRPLRLLAAIEAGGRRYELGAEPSLEGETRRVFSTGACNLVREMMTMGAREGTGRHLMDTTLHMGTKTGTTEKVPSELCLHVELGHNQEALDEPAHTCGKACRAALRQREKPHRRACYTSSICVFGCIPGTDRELMVVVVVDEPRGKEKFGSQVAGPAAMRILQEALGRTVDGRAIAARLGEAADAVQDEDFNDLDAPWAEADPGLVRGGGEPAPGEPGGERE